MAAHLVACAYAEFHCEVLEAQSMMVHLVDGCGGDVNVGEVVGAC